MNKRVFVAFPIPREVREHLGAVAQEIASRVEGEEFVRWVDPGEMHITAHFLGDLDEAGIEVVREVCRETAGKFRPATVRLGVPAWFPKEGPPRVVTVSVVEDAGLVLRQLQAAIGRRLERQGIDVDHRLWTPHVTLGRVKTTFDATKIRADVNPLDFLVDSILFLESHRTENGATYAPLDIFPLHGVS